MGVRVIMPKLTHDMNAGVLLAWLKKEGDSVTQGDAILSIETDKAAVDLEAEESGILCRLRYHEGDEAPVGAVLAEIDTGFLQSGSKEDDRKNERSREATPRAVGRIPISPLAKKIAREHGVPITDVRGTGPDGRIVRKDVQEYIDTYTAVSHEHGELPYMVIPMSKVRKTIAARMIASTTTIPWFDVEIDTDMTAAVNLRKKFRETTGIPLSYTAIIVKAIASALKDYIYLNARFEKNEYRVFNRIYLGIAAESGVGTVVPVIRNPDGLPLAEIQKELDDLKSRVLNDSLAQHDLESGTFTLSNLGMYSVDSFRAIINPPEVAIIAVGCVHERPVSVGGTLTSRPTMRMNLSVDHRVVDGAYAARFLGAVKENLETIDLTQEGGI